jgi:hypothetical protein
VNSSEVTNADAMLKRRYPDVGWRSWERWRPMLRSQRYRQQPRDGSRIEPEFRGRHRRRGVTGNDARRDIESSGRALTALASYLARATFYPAMSGSTWPIAAAPA